MGRTNREVTLGCHSFEQYLSPRYETVFILNEDFVNIWGIDKLVQSTTCDQTLGAHVLMLDNTGGELLGRRLAVDFLEKEESRNHRKLEFLNQMNCDVHPLPNAHVMHMNLDAEHDGEDGQRLSTRASPAGASSISRDPSSSNAARRQFAQIKEEPRNKCI